MKHYKSRLIIFLILGVLALYCIIESCCNNKRQEVKTVICIPVYGQSLALGEEAVRITNFDSLKVCYNGRIVTENLDYNFGYFDGQEWKQGLKKMLRYQKKSFELSVYSMAESLVTQLEEDTMICIFPGGAGMSSIQQLNKSTDHYNKFLGEIEKAYSKAQQLGWKFFIPAICWMQGETDIIDYTNIDYKKCLKQFYSDVNKDIKAITKQKDDIRMICYQSNVLTRAENFDANNYDCIEMKPAQAIVDLIKEDSLFWASGPTYPYTFINEKLHIDAIGQQTIGKLDAIAIMNIIKGKHKVYGLTPRVVSSENNDILIHMNVPCPPMVFDTTSVKPIDYYGFSVITKNHENIISSVKIEGDTIRLTCSKSPQNCKVRYAVNGEHMKSGRLHGPRGNLRDSQQTPNWCYQFDKLINCDYAEAK